MRKLAGFLMIILGILQGMWIVYNLFIERQPEFQEPVLPIGYTTLSLGLITVGIKWLRTDRSLDTGAVLCPYCNTKYQKNAIKCPNCGGKVGSFYTSK